MPTPSNPGESRIARRDLLKVAAAGAAITAVPDAADTVAEPAGTLRQTPAPPATPATGTVPPLVPTTMTVNGQRVSLDLDARSSLLDVLREQLGMVGAKKGCDHGQCGACTVHLDGQRVVSCLTPAVQTNGRDVATIEGLAGAGGALHPMQQAFIDHDALQCGYCTPGQIMAAVAAVREGNAGSDAAIRETMSGNLCRCGAYTGILAAVRQAAPQLGGE